MRLISLIIGLFFLYGQLHAQQFDLYQHSFKYDLESMGLPSDYNFFEINVKLSIDNNGIFLKNFRSNYYYRLTQVMRSKNPKLGLITNSITSQPATIQSYCIEKKMLGNSIRRHFFTENFDPRIASILSQKIHSHLIDSIGFKELSEKEVFVLDETYFKKRIYFENMRRQHALYLPFASALLAKPKESYDNVHIDLIFGLVENHKEQEYLHIELILNKNRELVFRTAINVFLDWSSLDIDEFANNNFVQNEIVSSLFHEIYTE